MRTLYIFFSVFICLLGFETIIGQDVSSFADKSNYGIHGGISVGSNYYNAIGASSARFAPFGYSINGHLNIQLGAINIPISATLNNTIAGYNLPLNMVGASPYYKWIKLHLGQRSLSFSPYVMNGRAFNGYGMELTPGIWNITAFRGKLNNLLAFRDTLTTGILLLPNYDRQIQGARIGIGKRVHKFELMAVQVRDRNTVGLQAVLPPQDNLVIGTSAKTQLFNVVSVAMNFSSSVFTRDQNARGLDSLLFGYERLQSIHNPNLSSKLSFAGDASVTYRKKGFMLGLQVKQIQPYYYSLATNFLQNDIRNYTLNTQFGLLKNKMRIRASAGFQSDNLSGQKAYTSNRIIGSTSINYFPSERLMVMLNYSNYQHESLSGLVAINDTFRIATTTNTFIFNTNLQLFKNESYKVTSNVNVFHNNLVDEGSTIELSTYKGTGVNLNFPVTVEHLMLTISPTIQYNIYDFADHDEGRVGGGIVISKPFLNKKLTTSLGFNIYQNQYDGLDNGQLVNAFSNIGYAISKKQKLSLRINYLDNENRLLRNQEEFRSALAYAWTF